MLSAAFLTSLHRLRLITPVIKDHGVDYERGKLQEKLDDGSLTLARTEVGVLLSQHMRCLLALL